MRPSNISLPIIRVREYTFIVLHFLVLVIFLLISLAFTCIGFSCALMYLEILPVPLHFVVLLLLGSKTKWKLVESRPHPSTLWVAPKAIDGSWETAIDCEKQEEGGRQGIANRPAGKKTFLVRVYILFIFVNTFGLLARVCCTCRTWHCMMVHGVSSSCVPTTELHYRT